MTEPTVQVPVSLIEKAQQAVASGDRGVAVDVVIGLAALSQPTPTVEPCGRDVPGTVPSWAGEDQVSPCACVLDTGHAGTHMCAHQTAAPPSIADMAPGTTKCADPNVNRWYCHRGADGTCPLPKCIDPSTIRDVTPPAVAQ